MMICIDSAHFIINLSMRSATLLQHKHSKRQSFSLTRAHTHTHGDFCQSRNWSKFLISCKQIKKLCWDEAPFFGFWLLQKNKTKEKAVIIFPKDAESFYSRTWRIGQSGKDLNRFGKRAVGLFKIPGPTNKEKKRKKYVTILMCW